jgi:hypothetical protein
MSKKYRAFVVAWGLWAAQFPVFAQDPIKAGDILISGSLRTRVESWDWFEAADTDHQYTFPGSLLRLSLSASHPSYDWQLEFAVPILLGLPDNAIAPGAQGQLGFGGTYFAANNRSTNTATLFAKQGYLRWRGIGGVDGQSLKIGRFEILDGMEVTPKDATLQVLKRDRIAQRLIGNFGFADVGRSFDGAQYVLTGKSLNLTVGGFRPTRGVFQVDGWGELNINLFYGALTGQVSGKKSASDWRLFAIGYNDDRDSVVKTDNRPLAIRRADAEHIHIGTYGGHYIGALQTPAGTIDGLAWGAIQTGSWGNLTQRAYAFALEGGWQPRVLPRVRPWIRGGYNYGSGDHNPNDATHGTFFQLMPTPRPYARFPFFNMMNTKDAFGELLLRPAKKVTVRSDVHWLRLADSQDLWYSGGGAFQPWTFGYTGRTSSNQSSLATLYDMSVDYNVSAHFVFSPYIGYAAGKSVIQAIYPQGQNGMYGYLELTYRF